MNNSIIRPPSVAYTLLTGIFSPVFFSPLSHSLRANYKLGEFQCIKINLLNTTVSERIQDVAKLCASIKGRKLRGAKITLYTVIFKRLQTDDGRRIQYHAFRSDGIKNPYNG